MTVKGTTGLVVTGFDEDIWEESFAEGMDFYCLNIPDYIGVTPVIGIASNVFGGYEFKSVSLSKNTIWLGEGVFSGCSNLEYIDFND